MVAWKIKRLGDGVLKVGHGKCQHKIESTGGKYPILATGGVIGHTDMFLYDKPSVLIGRKGTIDRPQYMDTPFWTIDTLFYTIISANYCPKFLYYTFCRIKWQNYNEASGVPSLSTKAIEDIEVLFPPISEQRAIAAVLSDEDGYISSLEKLLAKKNHIKQGVMQALLTGKRRLPEFCDVWQEKRIGDIGMTYSGLTGKNKTHFGKGNARYITFLNVLLNTTIDTTIVENVDVEEFENQNLVRVGDLFFNTSSETPEEVGMCAVLTKEVENTYLNSFCFGFRGSDTEVDGLFFSYYFNGSEGRKIMMLLAQGATRYNLSKAYFNDIVLRIPTLAEQSAIATVLSDMDAEIDKLTAKLKKAKEIKQGMMSELLTGRIRLISEATDHGEN